MKAADPAVIVGKVYDAAFNSEIWPELHCDIIDFCGVENAAPVIIDPAYRHSSVVTPRANPNVVAAYGQLWWESIMTNGKNGLAPDLRGTRHGRRRCAGSLLP